MSAALTSPFAVLDHAHMMNEQPQLKSILLQIAKNVATCAETLQAFETYANKEGWDSRELHRMRMEAASQLEVVFNPLFDAIEDLEV
jgi:hypothetical protein